MAAPLWKLYNADGAYVSSTKDLTVFAAALGAFPGATVRYGHRAADTVWREGADGLAYDLGYDAFAAHCYGVVKEWETAKRDRVLVKQAAVVAKMTADGTLPSDEEIQMPYIVVRSELPSAPVAGGEVGL